ncbi:MAG TPA: NAD(P)/FAD-dependent oxidoreductase [Gemmatimonadales bacterium]|nr:NAD(P)/FAD-dependent oxidoreductase [Gemmatimonadales bacterium]
MSQMFDAVVVGAGPYGLSTAAHLAGRGLSVGVFGKTLDSWRTHMPKGMVLRSHWWATNLSDPRGRYSFARFFDVSPYKAGYPMPRQAFVDYGLWFQRNVVPDVDETLVATVERGNGHFRLVLEDGRELGAQAVVMATGLTGYAHRPAEFAELPPDLVSHSSEHADFERFRGKRVMIVGGGQSAVEYAALLAEGGAQAHLVARRPIAWLEPDHVLERSLWEKMLAPKAGIAPGWVNWGLDHLPYLFYRFPQSGKDRYNARYFSGASDWLRHRVIGKVALHEACTVLRFEPLGFGMVRATLSNGDAVDVEHVVLATGFRPDLTRLGWINPPLREAIQTYRGSPLLSHWFESSVPGLYFIGFSSIRTFGPLYRFVAGCPAASRRVAAAVERQLAGRRTVLPRPALRHTVVTQGSV